MDLKKKLQEARENYIMTCFINCTLHQMLFVMKSRKMRWEGRGI
jgi:hypothetical protein